MAKVLQRLTKMGVVASHHGKGGGYHLARPSDHISVADIIQAIDGPVLVTACSEEDETCEQYAKCNVRDPLWRLKDRIVQALVSFTLQELAEDDGLQSTFPVLMASGETTSASTAERSAD